MTRMMRLLTFGFALTTATAFAQTTPSATPGAAQPAAQATRTPAAPQVCDGVVVTVRVSEIKPGATVEQFMAAAAAHQAWYRSHGVTDNQIVTARINLRDPVTRAYVYSDKQVLAYHINPPKREIPHDDGYEAFVKMYHDTSDVKETFNTCMPKTQIGTPGLMPAGGR